MEQSEITGLPEAFKQIHQSLQSSFIKPRHEASLIRRVLAHSLDSAVNPEAKSSISRPLSLIEPSNDREVTPQNVRGIQKDYLHCIRANISARIDFAETKKFHVTNIGKEINTRVDYDGDTSNGHVQDFLGLIEQQQKYEVLSIIQDYVDILSKRPAAEGHYLDPQVALAFTGPLPSVPSEVLNAPRFQQQFGGADLKVLTEQLEKSVLRAKILLEREQKLLARVREAHGNSGCNQTGRLQALGVARNELIQWIETELLKAGESPDEEEKAYQPMPTENMASSYIQTELVSIDRQYTRYLKARQGLVIAMTGRITGEVLNLEKGNPGPSENLSQDIIAHGGSFTLPYLEEMIAVLSEQKATIHQKSHLTVSLAKQLKDLSQKLDRQTDESHLLPAYPMHNQSMSRKGLESASFGDEISNHEKPDSSKKVRAWVYSSEAAASITKESILEKLEEGSMAIDETQQVVGEIRRLLGDYIKPLPLNLELETEEVSNSRDIWAGIDGNLGAIKK
ncbi:hypothetical protein BGZ60DRAFT_416385 [Tricladium varicosporioides]|nr:hypothetical protein BGZ60DRAFT_416385 [Hymenoscyphus varicosporioides]